MDENNYKEADKVLTEMEAIVGTIDPDIAAARTLVQINLKGDKDGFTKYTSSVKY